MEEFRQIKDFPGYFVSRSGEIGSICNGFFKLLSPSPDRDGYYHVKMNADKRQLSRLVHRIVALAFLPEAVGKPEINHIDGNPRNNKLENLEWTDRSGNIQHTYKTLKRHTKEGTKKSDFTYEEIRKIKLLLKMGDLRMSEIALIYGVSRGRIHGIKYGSSWRNI